MKIRWRILAPLVTALVAAALLVGPVGPASADGEAIPDSTQVGLFEPFGCSGYVTLATHNTPAGNSYTTKGNVCFYWSSTEHLGTVSRFQCFRNGQPYGDGAGGCRWTWVSALQSSTSTQGPWATRVSNSHCFTCGGIFVQDTDRFWGTTINICNLYVQRIARVVTYGTQTTADQVRFSLADGSQVLKDMANNTFSSVYNVFPPTPC